MPSPAAERRRLLIFEPNAEGHSLEWLAHLIHYRDPGTEISIVAPAELCRALRCAGDTAVQTIALTPREAALCVQRPLSLAAFTRWRLMRRHLRESGAEHGFFLTIDLLAMPLAFGLGFGGRSVSGILFRPSVHYAALGPYRPSLGERLRDWRKDVFYRLMLRNRALARVLSLDPFFPDYARRRYPDGAKVESLPDPAQQPVEKAAPPAHPESEFVPPGRIGFLLFGYLAERKGPLAVLDALALLKPGIASRVAVLLAGKVDPAIADRLEHRRRVLARCQPALWLRL
jgi:hypothetical protein